MKFQYLRFSFRFRRHVLLVVRLFRLYVRLGFFGRLFIGHRMSSQTSQQVLQMIL